jgi:hypothetical protein
MELSRPKKKKPQKVASSAAAASIEQVFASAPASEPSAPPVAVAANASPSVVAALPSAPSTVPASLLVSSLPSVPLSVPPAFLVSSLPSVPSSLVVPAFPSVPTVVAETPEHFSASSAPPLEELPPEAMDAAQFYVSSYPPISYPKLTRAALSDVDEEGLLRSHLPKLEVADEDDNFRGSDDRFVYLLERYRESIKRHVAAVEERDLLGRKCWELEDQDRCWQKETRFVTEKRLCGDGVVVEERHEFTVAHLLPEKLKEVCRLEAVLLLLLLFLISFPFL